MQQRQLRLGDILDDYCTRERRLTNHAVVAMVGNDVKQTRCTTCDTEHEYKHAKVPRQRRKSDSPAALFAQVVAGAPKVVAAPQAAASIRADEHSDDLDLPRALAAFRDDFAARGATLVVPDEPLHDADFVRTLARAYHVAPTVYPWGPVA